MRDSEVISTADIEGAERLMGVGYTDAERRQMLENLDGQIASALARRKIRLENSMPAASRFDPRPPNFRTPAPQGPLRFTRPAWRPLPSDEQDIAFASLGELAAWIASGELTSRRLTEIYLERIDALGPKLECFAVVAPKRALAEADAADALLRGGRASRPAARDSLTASRISSTPRGSSPAGAPSRSATACRTRMRRSSKKLRAAGAVLLGKTTVGALAYNDLWYGGWTRNPWNLNEGSSGSSAGSASATAAGLCAFSIGTETLGSITSPSQRCGTTGLRPTFGRVSRAGGMSLCWSLDKVGPICRSVEDTAMVLAAINGGGSRRPLIDRTRPSISTREAGIAGLKLGYLPEAFGEGATDG